MALEFKLPVSGEAPTTAATVYKPPLDSSFDGTLNVVNTASGEAKVSVLTVLSGAAARYYKKDVPLTEGESFELEIGLNADAELQLVATLTGVDYTVDGVVRT